ncbi:uncharacterized protein N7506_000882 [Penicillium brevicompactum]|uniref:uncharacterized protein n=1 Tax=Penicillium brevicompactum TaxID=5074 RepID=UPI0025412528|nr:uncharacterized protein N7506_000882 [Penicillium brevicompactum]KAJ5347629.1 hypothetical protein N7506_000882 [Penicillium brevicompactum]
MTKLRVLRLYGWHRRLSTPAKSSLADPALQMPGFNQPLNNRTGPHEFLPNVLDEDQMDDDGFKWEKEMSREKSRANQTPLVISSLIARF